MPTTSSLRSRPDLCPGVFRPWAAEDGALVRLRLIGGRLAPRSLAALSEVARKYGDGDLHLTRRANLQLRGLPTHGGTLLPEVVCAIEATGLLPSRSHELVRNLMVSPQTGVSGGRADLRPVAAELDDVMCENPRLAGLPGRFLFVLDDGRGDLVGRSTDLGLMALDLTTAQLRVGSTGWGPVIELAAAARALADLALRFLDERGDGPGAPWHVEELTRPMTDPVSREAATTATCPPLPFGRVAGGEHVPAPHGVLDSTLVGDLVGHDRELVVTPWRGVLIPSEEAR